jgi:hypothetical protein
MNEYEAIRQRYKPTHIKLLLIAESPPPAAGIPSSRQFYRAEYTKGDDRLFRNTILALYPDAEDVAANKERWLRQLQMDGVYMIEALEESQPHEVTKPQRQEKIKTSLPRLIERVKELATSDTKIVLIKSNVFEVAVQPLREAGFTVLNTELVDYPGRFNQQQYRKKLSDLLAP